MDSKLIITKHDNKIISAFFEGRDMVQVNMNPSRESGILGNIYLGKVKNIVNNINAAFIEIADGKMCYYSMADNHFPIMSKKQDGYEASGKLIPVKIKTGDELIVQVTKEDIKTKAPVVSSNINLTGKYVALTYGKSTIGISTKIIDDKERQRLKKLAKKYENSQYGFILRTNAAFVPEDKIINEINTLIDIYNNIRTYGIHKSCFSMLYETPPGYICDIRDGYTDKFNEIITDDKELYVDIEAYLLHYQVEDLPKLRLYNDKLVSLSSLYGINDKLSEAIRPLVWLKSGGSIIIQPTEALTVIDVNTGKAVAGKKVQETFLKINLEAAKEIAKQIRLRNLSGIIIIDFIDLEANEDKIKLMNILESYLNTDPVKTILVDMTALGLVEVTRKKVRKPLHEQIT